jgi:DNA-directed RNA polymerase subunit RPC12/RpoP
MNAVIITKETSKMVQCPYCGQSTTIIYPENYVPVYKHCGICSKKFIVERLAHGFQVLTREEAPLSSDPDCREIEMGASDEQ